MFTAMTTNLMVASVDRSIEFYQGTLGFEVAASVPGKKGELQFAIVVKDGLNLMMQERENLIEEYPVLGTDAVHPSVTLYILVDDFDGLYARLSSTGPIEADVHTSFYGTREFAVTDPDGYVLTFAEKGAA